MADEPRTAGATRLIDRGSDGRVLMVRRATLSVARGSDKGQSIAIEAAPLVVGSDPRCDLVLQDSSVSARHFVIEPGDAGFLLRDLDSTNGTLVDGLRVQGVFLPRSAEIDAGQSRLRFATSKEELEVPLSRRTRFGELLGHSNPMRQVFAILERVADTNCTVLLEGASGTGKELAARALHDASSRGGLFVAVDCGALPSNLIESELFGHARGAFTGAATDRGGLFEEADGGTLLLDEIGELPLDLQPKLLRVLETRTVRRLGESQPRPVDVRLIAATNRNLAREVAARRFREDLFFRLGVIRVRMPGLRERREEIPRLVSHFVTQLGRDATADLPDDSMMAMLQQYPWPGNVRELRNVVERLVLLPGMQPEFYLDGAAGSSDRPEGDGSPPSLLDHSFHEGKRLWTERFEREYLGRQLQRCKGNVSELARVCGLSRQSCHRLLARHGLGGRGDETGGDDR